MVVSDNESWIGAGRQGATAVLTEWNAFVRNQARLHNGSSTHPILPDDRRAAPPPERHPASLFHHYAAMGLAIASDIGILMHTVVIAWLLNRKGIVPFRGLRWLEILKAGATALLAAAAAWAVSRYGFGLHGRWDEAARLALITLTWAAASAAGLWVMRSELIQRMRRG